MISLCLTIAELFNISRLLRCLRVCVSGIVWGYVTGRCVMSLTVAAAHTGDPLTYPLATEWWRD